MQSVELGKAAAEALAEVADPSLTDIALAGMGKTMGRLKSFGPRTAGIKGAGVGEVLVEVDEGEGEKSGSRGAVSAVRGIGERQESGAATEDGEETDTEHLLAEVGIWPAPVLPLACVISLDRVCFLL